MHRDLKELLKTAESESHRVVVVFLDVRGFSTFAKVAESSDSAEFLKSVYLKILDDYFADASFFKPTGDGLLILLEYKRETLKDVVRNAVDQSVRLVEDFASMTDGDDMINFDVPKDLGIGLARGGATALVAEGKVLDYSGRPLNLASRLMDIARPAGVVFDATLGLNLLDAAVAKRFKEESVYIKGLAEDKAMSIHYLADRVIVSPFNKRPLNSFERKVEKPWTMTMKEFRELGLYNHQLSGIPCDPEKIEVHVEHPAVMANGKRHPSRNTGWFGDATLVSLRGQQCARYDYTELAHSLTEEGVKSTWPVVIRVEYDIAG
jgi:class 3 adenylate cyclase